MIEILIDKITGIISLIGYFGVFILMMLESTMIPIPAEAVMPFAGFLAAMGKMNIILIIIISTLASLCGSLISYWIGHKYSDKVIRRFGKYLMLDESHLLKAENYFRKHGGKTIFIARFIPGIRHVISIPAGVGKMSLKKFCLFTAIGAGLWNSFLLLLGYILQKNWEVIYSYTEILDMVVIFFIVAFIVYWFYSSLKKNKS